MNGTLDGRVIANFGRHITVETGPGDTMDCRIKGRSLRPVCGDRVTLEQLPDGSGRILAIQQRHSVLVRHDARSGKQPLAANIDRMIVVVAPKPALDPYMIDRYLAAGALLEIPAIILFNKTDLLTPDESDDLERVLKGYSEIGYPVLRTSVKRHTGLTALADTLRFIEIRNDETVVSMSTPDIPSDHRNLAYQAAELLRRSQGIKRGVKIEIEKRIPAGAGLGGGSSNAASVLCGRFLPSVFLWP